MGARGPKPSEVRLNARKSGAIQYLGGPPCVRGHVGSRYLTGGCVACAIQRARAREMAPDYRRVRNSAERAKANAKYLAKPEKAALHRVAVSHRRARLKNADGSHTAEQVNALLVQQRHKCALCKTSVRKGYEKDHIRPLSKGGSNVISNIQLLCRPCNRRKADIDPIEFSQRNGLLL